MEDNFAVIFDMDGVLVDTPKIVDRGMKVFFQKRGVSLNEIHKKKMRGRTLKAVFEMVNEEFGTNIDFERDKEEFWSIQQPILEEELKTNEGIKELLEELISNNIKIAVGTSSSKIRTDYILDLVGLKDHFDTIITSCEVKLGKPHPDIFLEAAKQLGIEPTKCLVIEDAVNGIQAAKKGKMKAIGFVSEVHGIEDFHEADKAIDHFSKLGFKEIKELF